MRNILLSLAVSTMLVLASAAQQTAKPTSAPAENNKSNFDGTSWWGYVKVLAADEMEGRETGSAGLKRAQAYVVEQLKKNGLEPAGADGFYQTMQFESRQIVESGSSLALI